jgi:UDP-N-acetylmuramyl tripeptide synthase
MVTGTNGKTTTAGLLAAYLQAQGHRVVHNTLGANLFYGVASTLALNSTWGGHLQGSVAVLEVDEATLGKVAAAFEPQWLVVTNLFRDQLDRYGELSTTAGFIEAAFPHVQQGVVLNAEDPRVAALGLDATTGQPLQPHLQRVLLQWQASPASNPLEPMDGGVPFAEEAPAEASLSSLSTQSPCYVAQLEEATPVPQLCLHAPPQAESHTQQEPLPCEPWRWPSPLLGLFNHKNAALAAVAALQVGVNTTAIAQGLQAYQGVFGRCQSLVLAGGKRVHVYLIKNPAGAAEVLALVRRMEPANVRLCVALADLEADGRDVSWVWDAPFEWLQALQASEVNPVWVSGRRAADMALRLQYAGLPTAALQVNPCMQSTLEAALASLEPHQTLVVLPTYTVLLGLNALWQRWQ